MNRRDFIKQLARVVAAAPLLSPLLRESGVSGPTLDPPVPFDITDGVPSFQQMPFHGLEWYRDVYLTKISEDVWELSGNTDMIRGLTI